MDSSRSTLFVLAVSAACGGALLVMCTRTSADAVVTSADGAADGGADGAADAGFFDLTGFTPACPDATADFHVLPVLHPSNPPDYWAARTETIRFGPGADVEDPDAGVWSAVMSDEVGTACATAPSKADCLAALTSLRLLGALCPYEIDGGGGGDACHYEYIVATRGAGIGFFELFDADGGVVVGNFGLVRSWQSAVLVGYGPVIGASWCTGKYPLSYRDAGADGFDLLAPWGCSDGAPAFEVVRVSPTAGRTQIFVSCR